MHAMQEKFPVSRKEPGKEMALIRCFLVCLQLQFLPGQLHEVTGTLRHRHFVQLREDRAPGRRSVAPVTVYLKKRPCAEARQCLSNNNKFST
jgi:hypothetical protein